MGDSPGQRDLGTALVVLVAEGDEDGVLDQAAEGAVRVVDFVLVAQRRVLGEVDVVVAVEGGEGGLA